MALGGILASALNPATAKRYALTINGLDVLLQPGQQGNAYGVPLDTVKVVWNGAGSVSSLTGRLDDPLALLPAADLLDHATVELWNLTDNVPYFGGFLTNLLPRQNATTIQLDMTCTGYETILDWAQLEADIVIPIGTTMSDAALTLAAAATPTYGLRAFTIGTASEVSGPIAKLAPISPPTLSYAVTVTAGTTLRAALTQLASAFYSANLFGGVDLSITVDFLRGLRIANRNGVTGGYADARTLTLAPTGADAPAADIHPERDVNDVVRSVFVKGANAAGTGTVTDGSGKPGRTAYLNDPDIDSAAKLADKGGGYLLPFAASWRGSVAVESWTPIVGADVGSGPKQVRVDGPIDLSSSTYAWMSSSSRVYSIAQLTRTFLGGTLERWDIQYGGRAASAMSLLQRRITGSITKAASQRP